MDDLTRQEFKDEFVFLSLFLFLILAGLIGYFTSKLRLLTETGSMGLFGLLGIVGLIGYFIIIYLYRKKSRSMGIAMLKEVSDNILGGTISGSDRNYFSIHGRYKDKAVCCIFINSHSNLTYYPGYGHLVTPSQIIFSLIGDKMPPSLGEILVSFVKKPRKITENVSLEGESLKYKPIALNSLFRDKNRKQKFINIFDELIQAAEMVES